jgi:hypothetical protein
MHLSADELVDLADGARPESSVPHLAVCVQCRAQLSELRAMVSAVSEVDVPEPSPLFWGHLSQRVHDRVAREETDARLAPARRWLSRVVDPAMRSFAPGMRFLAPASAVVAAAVVAFLVSTPRLRAPNRAAAPATMTAVVGQPAAARDLLADSPIDDDPSLSLVASLASAIDAEAPGEAGLAQVGSAEHAMAHMNDTELRELQRLLQQELSPSGD